MNCCLQQHTTHKFTFFLLFISNKFKNEKNMKIQEVHQMLQAKQFLLFYLNCFLLATHLNLMRLEKHN